MPNLKLDDVALHYQTTGLEETDGVETIVLIHGLGANLAFWYMGVARWLARKYRIIIYDLRGHGRSSVPSAGYTLQHMAEDLRRLLDALAIEQAHVVGHSYGARVALYYAICNPNRVSTLTVADTQIRSLQPPLRLRDWTYWPTWKQELEQQSLKGLPDDDAVIDFRLLSYLNSVASQSRHGVSGARQGGSSLRRYDMGRRGAARWEKLLQNTICSAEFGQDHQLTLSALQSVSSPTLAIYGQHSHCLPCCWRLKELIPQCQVQVVPESGHFHPVTRPRYFVRRLSRFLGDRALAQTDPSRLGEPRARVQAARGRRRAHLQSRD
ncbi:MAG: alpha/beta hydrolase [Gammaproteobacteria bacterium]|nr:alpha/beta hydrolase [Gammaproteobacteria bacterium]